MDFDSMRASERYPGRKWITKTKRHGTQRGDGRRRNAAWHDHHHRRRLRVRLRRRLRLRRRPGTNEAGRRSIWDKVRRFRAPRLRDAESTAQRAARCTFTLPLLPRASANCRVCGRYSPTPHPSPPFQPRRSFHLSATLYFRSNAIPVSSPPRENG